MDTITALGVLARTYLTFQLGAIHFGPATTSLIVAAIAAALASVAHLWRIGQKEDRLAHLEELRSGIRGPTAPAAAPRPRFYHRLGRMIAQTPIIGAGDRERIRVYLAEAGFKAQSALWTVITAKLGAALGGVALFWLLVGLHGYFASMPLIRPVMALCALVLGWLLPELVINRLAARRKVRLEVGMPDAIDLLVICAEAGLSLDQAIEQVGHDMRASNLAVADEFEATAAEMRVLPERGQALDNLVKRTGIQTLRSLVATLTQSIRFGTPLAESLRVIAAEMRAERMARFEQNAAKLPVILTVVMMIFILPALLMLIGTPLVLRVAHLVDALHGGRL